MMQLLKYWMWRSSRIILLKVFPKKNTMSRIMPGSSKNTMSGSGKSIGSEAEFATLTRYLGVRIAGTVNAAVPPILSQELQPTYLSCTHNIVEKIFIVHNVRS